jgi:hypothetical protein
MNEFKDNINNLVELAYRTNSDILFRDEHKCQNEIRNMDCILGFGRSIAQIYRVHFGNIIELLLSDKSVSLADDESALLTSLKSSTGPTSLYLIQSYMGEYQSFAKFCPFCGLDS